MSWSIIRNQLLGRMPFAGHGLCIIVLIYLLKNIFIQFESENVYNLI